MRWLWLVVILLCGCESWTIAVDTIEHTGAVYECEGEADTLELCYFEDSADELGELTGRSCSGTDRFWPWLTNALGVGCYYECPPKHRGCNATSGCYCP
jgi:hypothetical protein